MFKIFAISFFALSFSASAAQVSYCFKALEKVPGPAPRVYCLENISISSIKEKVINVDSQNRSVPDTLDVTEFRRHNEDRVKFTAEYVYEDRNDRSWQCAEAFEIKLVVKGETEVGMINLANLKVSVEVFETRDMCHDFGRTTVFHYELMK